MGMKIPIYFFEDFRKSMAMSYNTAGIVIPRLSGRCLGYMQRKKFCASVNYTEAIWQLLGFFKMELFM